MLISSVPEESPGIRERERVNSSSHSHQEYQNANELLDHMTDKHNFRPNDYESLTKQDLILLYKNIDVGNKLMSCVNESKKRVSNQYVVNLTHKDSDNDLHEVGSKEDLQNIMLINNERIDLIDSTTVETSIYHKFGEIGSSHRTFDCSTDSVRDRFNDFNDDFKLFNLDFPVFPQSSLDPICDKRIGDNYDIYMDGIIKFAKHTIQQLERISNGDYLTDKVQEKWKKACTEGTVSPTNRSCTNNSLIAASNLPIYVDRMTRNIMQFDNFLESGTAMKLLPKVFEINVVFEVPKSLNSSSMISNKCNSQNAIINSKRSITPKKPTENHHVGVIVKIEESNLNNTDLMMVLQKSERIVILPLPCVQNNIVSLVGKKEEPITVTELQEHDKECVPTWQEENYEPYANGTLSAVDQQSNDEVTISADASVDKDPIFPKYNQCNKLPSTNNMVPKDSNEEIKGRSKTKIRSPYENRSLAMEERKRKRLLAIRLNRERKKLIQASQSGSSKFRTLPIAVDSITQLSITNKSFYTSIFGQGNSDAISTKLKIRKDKKQPSIPETSDFDETNSETQMTSQNSTSNGYDQSECSEFSKFDKNDFKTSKTQQPDSNLPTNFATCTEVSTRDITNTKRMQTYDKIKHCESYIPNVQDNDDETTGSISTLQDLGNIATKTTTEQVTFDNTSNVTEERLTFGISNGPNTHFIEEKNKIKDPKKPNTSAEFRKSIDQIYHLIHRLGKFDDSEVKLRKSKFTAVANTAIKYEKEEIFSTEESESGRSGKRHISPDQSCSNLKKVPSCKALASRHKKQSQEVANIVPKVVISAKTQSNKVEEDKDKKECRKISPTRGTSTETLSKNSPTTKLGGTEKSMRAITQLLSDFDNVHKALVKNKTTEKVQRKPEATSTDQRLTSKTQSRGEISSPERKPLAFRDRKSKQSLTGQYMNVAETNHLNKMLRKRDIIDEMKEAKGEAVRGPPRINSRINSLAQPKKTYVKAQIEEFQSRYGNSVVTDRLKNLSSTNSKKNKSGSGSPKPRRVEVIDMAAKTPSVVEKFPKKPITNNMYDKTRGDHSGDRIEKNLLRKKGNLISGTLESKPEMARTSVDTSVSGGHKSRVPYIPSNFENALIISPSASWLSTEIKTRRRHMLNVTIPVDNLDDSCSISPASSSNKFQTESKPILTGGPEINTDSHDLSIKNIASDPQNCTLLPKHFEHTVKTKREHIIGDTIPEEISSDINVLEPTNKISNCTILSIGRFSNTLTKKCSLTPTVSIQKLLRLQSGDTNYMILHTALSQNLRKSESFNILQKDRALDLTFARWPSPPTTVGYSFPVYDRQVSISKTNVHDEIVAKLINLKNKTVEKTVPSHEGEGSTQSDIKDQITFSNVVKTEVEQPYLYYNKKEEPESMTRNSKLGTVYQSGDQKLEMNVLERNETKHSVEYDTYHTKSELVHSNTSNVKSKEPPICITNEPESVELLAERDPTPDYNCKRHPLKENSFTTVSKVGSNISCIDFSKSLDVLVGLLTEIQTITTCQNEMAYNKNGETDSESMQCILQDANDLQAREETRNIISISSLDKLRQLDNKDSFISVYLSDSTSQYEKLYIGEEVSTELSKTYVNKYTNVPSTLLPVTVSTNVSSSLLGVLSQPSSQSLFTCDDDNTLKCIKQIINLPTNENICIAKTVQTTINEDFIKNRKHLVPMVKKRRSKVGNDFADMNDSKPNNLICETALRGKFDPVMKFKRDILVTVYSFLVLTIFAALSFPDIMYRS